MRKLSAGTKVRSGHYFDLKSWKLVTMSTEGDALPGEPGESYVRLPVVAVLLLAPMIGGAFVLFLPFIGFYLVTATAARRVGRAFSGSATEIAATMRPGWKPGEAHLAGRGPEEEKGKEPPIADELSELERTIEERRRNRE